MLQYDPRMMMGLFRNCPSCSHSSTALQQGRHLPRLFSLQFIFSRHLCSCVFQSMLMMPQPSLEWLSLANSLLCANSIWPGTAHHYRKT